MSSLTIDLLAQRFSILPEQEKQEVFDFINFLIAKKKTKQEIDKKKILLGMSCWNENDIKAVNEAREHLNQWKPKVF